MSLVIALATAVVVAALVKPRSALLARVRRLWAAQIRAHELFDARQRPWEADVARELRAAAPRSATCRSVPADG